MKQFLKDRYIDFDITKVSQTGDMYCFEIQLLYRDGQTIRFSGPSCSSEVEAEQLRKEHVKRLKNHSYILDPDFRVGEFFEAWLKQIAKPKVSGAVFSAYANAVQYIVERYGRLKLCLMSEAHVVSIFKGAVECPLREPEFVKEVLKKALKFAKKVGYINYDPARDEMLFSAWFIADDRLSSSDDIKTSEDGWPIWDCGEIIDEYIKEMGMEFLEDE